MSRRLIKPPALLLGTSAVLAVLAILAGVAIQTGPVRASVKTYTSLIAAANRQDVPTASSLCTARYLVSHPLMPAAEGGLVGLPRGIHPNFQAWREGENVWLCPRNRIGPVYQFVREREAWRFDGLVGLLRSGNELVPLPEGASADDPMALEGDAL